MCCKPLECNEGHAVTDLTGLEHREGLRHGPDGGADIFSFFGQSMHASQPSRIYPAAE